MEGLSVHAASLSGSPVQLTVLPEGESVYVQWLNLSRLEFSFGEFAEQLIRPYGVMLSSNGASTFDGRNFEYRAGELQYTVSLGSSGAMAIYDLLLLNRISLDVIRGFARPAFGLIAEALSEGDSRGQKYAGRRLLGLEAARLSCQLVKVFVCPSNVAEANLLCRFLADLGERLDVGCVVGSDVVLTPILRSELDSLGFESLVAA